MHPEELGHSGPDGFIVVDDRTLTLPSMGPPGAGMDGPRPTQRGREEVGREDIRRFAPRPRFVDGLLGFVPADAERVGHPDEVGQRARAHLLHHPAPMNLHGDLAESERPGDLLVHKPVAHESHHFLLAIRCW